jgi:spore maturation protein CgeB
MPDTLPPTLRNNLAALQKRDLALFRRIIMPVGSDHVQQSKEGGNFYQVHRSWHTYDLGPGQVASSLSNLESEHIFLFGLGAGEQLLALLKRDDVVSILAWDRDPWLLRLLLTAHDLSAAIRSGRLRLALGADLLDGLEDELPRDAVVHPFFADQYRLEYALLQTELQPLRALVCAGTLFVDDLAESLTEAGYSCFTWDVQRLAPEELAITAKRFGASVVAGINYTQGIAEACRDLGLQLLIWEIDPATDPLTPCTPPAEHAHIFSYRKAQVPVFAAAGFPNASYLPLAANPARRFPAELDATETPHYRAPLAFVGASMREQANLFRDHLIAEYCLWRGGSPGDARRDCCGHLEALQNAHRDDFSRSQVATLLDEVMPEFMAAMRSKPGKPDPVILASEMIAADKRLFYVENLGARGIHVWGDAAWQATEEHGAVYRGVAGHRFELNKIYGSATINIDIGRIYQNDMVTMRVFDVMACGGFVLTERNDALLELFTEGVELDCYTSLQELLDKVEHYSARPDEAAAIAARGYEAVLANHTISGRVAIMLESLSTK